MTCNTFAVTLLCGSTIALAQPAQAQALAGAQQETAQRSETAVTGGAASMQAQIESLQAQVQALQQALEGLKSQQAKVTPSWRGAPQLVDKDAGWSFKPRGRLMYDFATVDAPDGYANAGLGFSNEIRRARLGVEGTMPGDFGYKLELDFAGGEAEFADAFMSYEPGAVEFILGQHNNFQSLEELTSSLHTSFIERAAFTDAFNFERRVGASATYSRERFLVQVGVFTDSIADLNAVGDDNNGYGFDGRAVFMPKLGTNQLHFGASAHWRDVNDSATSVRYRQRPLVHSTDIRFVDTGNLAGAEKEAGYGLEAAGIFGPFYVAGEAYWQKLSRTGFSDPGFFGMYADIGYFLTGETRGYKEGKFDRVKVRNPFGKGGWGALSINARYDFLDLIDAGIVGGKQNAYQASLNWKPVDYVLLGLNYAHIVYDDAAISASGERNYSVDTVGLRSQVDF